MANTLIPINDRLLAKKFAYENTSFSLSWTWFSCLLMCLPFGVVIVVGLCIHCIFFLQKKKIIFMQWDEHLMFEHQILIIFFDVLDNLVIPSWYILFSLYFDLLTRVWWLVAGWCLLLNNKLTIFVDYIDHSSSPIHKMTMMTMMY